MTMIYLFPYFLISSTYYFLYNCSLFLTVVLPIIMMLTIFIALVALLTPTVTSWVSSDHSNSSDHFRVDLGYQLNQGQAVVVCSFIFARLLVCSFARLLQLHTTQTYRALRIS